MTVAALITNIYFDLILLVYNDQKTSLKYQRKKCKEYPYYKNYEAKRRNLCDVAKIRHKVVRRIVKNSSKRTEYRNLMGYLMMALLMFNITNRIAAWWIISILSGQFVKLSFSHTPSESCLWWNVSRLPIGLLDELLVFAAGKETHESLLVDSSFYTYNRYE